jgi:TIR domain-containing protein/NB-ARC domain-containing protein
MVGNRRERILILLRAAAPAIRDAALKQQLEALIAELEAASDDSLAIQAGGIGNSTRVAIGPNIHQTIYQVIMREAGVPELAKQFLEEFRPIVFLSYAWKDDKLFVEQLYADLTREGLRVWWDEQDMPASGSALREELRTAIDAAERFMPVIGPAARDSESVQLEWNHARAGCKAVVPILRLGDDSLLPEDWRGTQAELFFDFRNDATYAETLAGLLKRLHEPAGGVGEFKGDTHSIPPKLRGAIARKEMQQLAGCLRPEAQTAAITGRAAAGTLHAPGGLGKTVLASMFAQNCGTRRAFPDGIFWIEIGKTPPLALKQAKIGQELGDDPKEYTDERVGAARLTHILRDRRALLILDDVWDYHHAEVFLVEAPRCRWLITTRRRGLGSDLELPSDNVIELGYLTDEEGIALIVRHLGLDPSQEHPDKATHPLDSAGATWSSTGDCHRCRPTRLEE